MGSSDVGDATYRCPALQPEIDISGTKIEVHTREFAQANLTEHPHEVLKTGAKVLSRSALAVFLDPELRDRMWSDYRREISAGREQ